MNNDIATTAMWDSAVTDHDAVERQGLMTRAKVALAGAWPFLAAAESEEDFGHRLALIADQIQARVPEQVRNEVVASLKEDWQGVRTAKLQAEGMRRQAALHIAKEDGDSSLPKAYVHVFKHAGDSAEDSVFEVTHVASPTFIQSLGHFDHDTAMQKAREFGLPHGLPVYENGRYVEGRKLAFVGNNEEYFDAGLGRWVAAREIPSVTAKGKEASNYKVDPDKAWRIHYPDTPPLPAQGGEPTAPAGATSIDPDGFSHDYAEGEDRSQIGYQRQLTPGVWAVPPNAGWPQRPNAGSPDMTPVNASRKQAGGDWVNDWSKTHGDLASEAHDRGEHDKIRSLVCPQCHQRDATPEGRMEHLREVSPTSRFSYRVTAQEGAAATPGPNPNYFSQGTQGIQGPAQFPQDPSADIEPKTNNHVDDFYGEVPPQASSGSAQGQVDGQGYSRQGSAHRRLAWRDPEDIEFNRKTNFCGDRYHDHECGLAFNHSGPHHCTLGGYCDEPDSSWHNVNHRNTASRLGFSRSAGERTAAFHPASPTALNEAAFVHENNDTDGYDSGFTPDFERKGIHVHDYPRAIEELRNNWQIHDDNLQDEWSANRRRDSIKKREVGKLLDSLRNAHQGSLRTAGEHAPYRIEKRDGKYHVVNKDGVSKEKDGYDSYAEARKHQKALYANVPGASESAKAASVRRMADNRSRKQHLTEEIDGPSAEDLRPDEPNRPSAYSRMSPEERAEFDKRWGTGEGWGKEPKTSSTNGRIVGLCDHCNLPVRYHDDQGGHLRHLHNNSPKCRDGGKTASAGMYFVKEYDRNGVAHDDYGSRGNRTFDNEPDARRYHQQMVQRDKDNGLHGEGLPYDDNTWRILHLKPRETTASVEHSPQFFNVEAAVLENPTAENPTGKGGDPYRAKTTWEGFERQRPRQELEGDGGMNANTPTTAPDPIKTGPNINTPTSGANSDLDDDGPRERDDDDEEDDD